MIASWPPNVDTAEQTRRLIDLFLVSVLLDAGAGTKWQYKARDSGKFYRRSEGLAVASMDMFKDGLFSSNPGQKEQVDGGSFLSYSVLCRFRSPPSHGGFCALSFYTRNPGLLTLLVGLALKGLTVEILAKALQVSETNPLAGLEGRSSLLIKLGEALDNQDLFGVDSRPGNMLGE